ncbi:caffeic acid 3-O-methyltransferase-like [Hibiscus syriacus]|uniref:Caffeic acid 3-O-methyltransferase-like n=1 Tax=Hibiscus syriacus TaxID=106335 RepID=A0A6A2WPN0_HIBSY|nr:caffeic acid 3-O-methyltransferase-like [Hibiscus syriacus]
MARRRKSSKDGRHEACEETEIALSLILNPFNPIDIAKLSAANDGDELSMVAERGQVACRDYPHSRHLCLQFPFDSTPHDKHCDLCYCYFVILLLLVSVGRHIAMPRSMSKTGDLNAVSGLDRFGFVPFLPCRKIESRTHALGRILPDFANNYLDCNIDE